MGGNAIDWNEDWEIYHLFAKSALDAYEGLLELGCYVKIEFLS